MGLRCLVSQTPAQRSKNLIWIEFAHNTLPSVSTGMSPFQCIYGYQPPLFCALEREVRVPGAAALLRRCCCTWERARQALLRTSSLYKTMADRHRTKGLSYLMGQRVRLSTRDLPLRPESRKWATGLLARFPYLKLSSLSQSDLDSHVP